MKNIKNKNDVIEKVSLRQCLKIFKGMKLPWFLMALTLALSLIGSFLTLNMAEFSGEVVDASGNVPVTEMVIYVSSALIVALFAGLAQLFMSYAGEKINLNLRKKLWRKIIVTKQSVYDADGGESLVSRVSQDCDFAIKFFTTSIAIIGLIATTTIYVVKLFYINVKMASYILIFIPASILIGLFYTFLRFVVAQRYQGKMAKITAYLVERTKDIPLIKTCNCQEKELEEGDSRFKELYKYHLRTGYVQAIASAIDTILNFLGIAIPFLVGAAFVQSGTITIGALIIFNSLFGNIRTSFNNLIVYAGDFKEANGALARVTKVFDLEEEDAEAGIALAGEINEDIAFENVSFGYTDDNMVVRNINCRIPKNKITAVVGNNGSGKSTIFKMMARLYDPKSGSLKFGDKNSADYSLHSWRKKVCLIAQGSPMMAGTIRDNICYGQDEPVSDEKLLEVAKLSHVYDFVKDLPDGFDTVVSAGGGNFSGGQKQCIAIARAMLSKADYLLLDEATSNLDVKREKDVMDAMNALMKNRTTVIIAHSLATIRNADHVIVLNNGNLEMEGAPSYILQKTDNYLSKLMSRGV